MIKKIKNDIKTHYLFYLLLIFIFLFGFWLRVEGVITDSFAFTYDVGRDLLQVSRIANDHDIVFIGQTTGLAGLFYGPWWYYILTIPFIAFSGNPQGVAIFMVFIGLTTVIFSYFLGMKLQGKYLGLIFATLLSFSPYFISLSNQIWNPNISQLIVVFILVDLYIIFSKGIFSLKTALILGLLLGLLLDSELVFGLLVSAGVFFSLIIILKRKILSRDSLFIFLGFLIMLFPRIAFELKNNFIMTRTILMSDENSIHSSVAFFDPHSFQSTIITMFSMFSDTFTRGDKILASVFILCVVGILVLFRSNISSIEKKFITTSLFIVLTFICALSFYNEAIYGHFFIALPVFYALLVAIALQILAKKGKYLVFLILGVFVLVNINPIAMISSFGKPIWEGNAAVYRNQLAVLDYVYKEANGKQFNYIAYTPTVHDYTYQYLFQWYGKSKYNYSPEKFTQTTMYVVMEPDHENQQRLIDWLKIREGDGRVVKEELVKGGIKVQTRIRKPI